ncbi:MAG: molybdopterin synthase sulfur carrier subunit [Kiritimatiellae bacterium]|nr:molybdopterin synthase sulfur carrier subunit [Kiritimatiellia bacterium]
MKHTKKIKIYYYTSLREQRGCDSETWKTKTETLKELYVELNQKHHFGRVSIEHLKVALNNEMNSWENTFENNDTVTFIPPVSGG